MATERRVGLDFDNTIITYDSVFRSAAVEQGLISADFSGGKKEIRDAIRLLPDGEQSWQQLQGQVYSKGIVDAQLFDGVDVFLRRCRRENIAVHIVSHKTKHGHHDPERINLRDAAQDWMAAHGFFRESGYGIPVKNIFFEDTRQDKLERIALLRCTEFIDDLEEVLIDPAFPSGVERILFGAITTVSESAPYVVCPRWRDIEEHIFRARA